MGGRLAAGVAGVGIRESAWHFMNPELPSLPHGAARVRSPVPGTPPPPCQSPTLSRAESAFRGDPTGSAKFVFAPLEARAK